LGKLIQMNRFYLTAYEELANYYAHTGDLAKATMYRDEEKSLTEEAQKNYIDKIGDSHQSTVHQSTVKSKK